MNITKLWGMLSVFGILLCAVLIACGGSSTGGSGSGATPLSIVSLTPPSGSIGAAYSFTFAATGGTAPYTWNITGGQLPGGLALKAATGVLSGTPTLGQTSNFTVTVTDAKSKTASQSYSVTINTAPPTLQSISIAPPMPSLNVGSTVQLAATGQYSDGSSQDLAGSATWKSSAPSMVSVTASGLATALMTGASPANITASFNGVSGTTQANVKAPNAIAVSPVLPILTIGGTQTFTALGKFADGTTADITSLVTWSSSSTATATVNGATATGLARGIATISASNSGVTGSANIDVTDKNFSNASLNGSYAVTLTAFDSRGPVFESGSITADGNGNIISGVEDINASTLSTNVALTGTYSITPDGRGTITLSSSALTRTFNVVLKSNSSTTGDVSGQLIQNDQQQSEIGTLEKQDATAFNNASIANTTYVFRVGGIDSTGQVSRVGLLTTDAAGGMLTGTQDQNDAGTVTQNVSIAGSVASVAAGTGRATASFGGTNYALYVVSASRLNFIAIDSSLPAVYGIAEKQTATAPPASGGYVFNVDTGGSQGRSWVTGQFDFSGTGLVDGTQIQDGFTQITVISPLSSFTVASNGRGVLLENTNVGFRNFIVYVVSPTRMYMLVSNDTHAASGMAELQQPPSGGFTAAALNGDYEFGAAETGESELTFVGQFVFDGQGNFYAVDDLSQPGTTATVLLLGGTYSVSSNGEVTMTVPAGAKIPTFTMFLISANRGFFLGTPDPDVNGVAELQ